jgi:hypothetical protein
MPASRFRFVSPGIYINEVDKSIVPAAEVGIGPIIIGRSEHGPSMRPVQVASYEDFVQIFGNPIPGNAGGDVWRAGNYTAPTYAPYAAQAYLNAEVGPVTFFRITGKQSDSATTAGKAGWQNTIASATSSISSNGGAYGLFLIGSGSSASHLTGTLAAIWYIDNGGAITLSGSQRGTGTQTTGSGILISSTGDNAEFTAIIKNSAGGAVLTSSFNFNAASDIYIRKVFNTNPIFTNSVVTTTTNLESYFLGESYERSIEEVVGAVSGLTAGAQFGVIVALESGSSNKGNMRFESQAAETGWFISQDLSDNNAAYNPINMAKLFKLVSLDEGEWTQKNIKVSIIDIKAAPYPDIYPYGTFSIQIRTINDLDKSAQVIETFSGLTLDPNSESYVARRIGDKYFEWDTVEKRLNEYGNYDSNSKYVRVVVNEDVDAGATDTRYLPFGILGGMKFKGFTIHSGSSYVSTFGSATSASAQFAQAYVKANATIADSKATSGLFVDAGNVAFTGSFVFPSFAKRADYTDHAGRNYKKSYFGVDFQQTDSSTSYYTGISDLAYPLPSDFATFDATSSATDYSYKFSLDDLIVSRDSSGVVTGLSYLEGARVAGTSATVIGTTVDEISGGYREVLASDVVPKFTVAFYGGFDGFDITEKEPVINNTILNNASEVASSAYYSLQRALDTIDDVDFVECNLIAMPGVTNTTLTQNLIEVCSSRTDALGIIDVENDYRPVYEDVSLSAESRRPDPKQAATNLQDRSLNNSYGSAFFPYVKIQDEATSQQVVVPSSVIALGTLASSEAASAVWFAPAGFVRGGITDGAAGLDVVGISYRLNADERDTLYEANINPIASFPSEGLVVFGQKTLQVTPSALDRINVRRLMIYVKREVTKISRSILFEQNVESTWKKFKNKTETFLGGVAARNGITEYLVKLDSTTTTPALIDRNIMYAKVYIKPARAIEFIALDFIITRSGAKLGT